MSAWVPIAPGLSLCFLSVVQPWASRSLLQWKVPGTQAEVLRRRPSCLSPWSQLHIGCLRLAEGSSLCVEGPANLGAPHLGSVVPADMGLLVLQ